MGGTCVVSTLTATTAQVAKYLERDDVWPFTATLVNLWQNTGMDISVLAHHLRALMEDVNEGSKYDLRQVDWEVLAERYVEMFDEAA